MYRWLKEYFTAFGKDFPFSAVADLNEYEIVRIIQYCIAHDVEYSPNSDEETNEPIVGKAIVDNTKI